MEAQVLVPASSANLGPGYDAFGLALGLYNRFSASLAEVWSVSVEGEGAGRLRTDGGNRVAQAMSRVFTECGRTGQAATVQCHNAIPTARGLGSSSAAIIGGMLLADALCDGGLDRARILELATEMEGHPDNVAAALLGGFTISWCGESGCRAQRFEPGMGLAVAVVVPHGTLPTAVSRGLLPETVSHADAAFNAGRAALLAAALVDGRSELLSEAFDDRLHEPYRRSAVPNFEIARSGLLRAGADGVALSGAGPTMLGIVCGEDDSAALRRAESIAEELAQEAIASESACMALPVDRLGARVMDC